MPAPVAYVTCGPAYEPIDAVRCLTNHSTGALGTLLSETLTAAGFAVTCFRGTLATHPAPAGASVQPFTTNQSLLDLLTAAPPPDVVFHAAALCDFALSRPSGAPGKIRSDLAELHLVLHPAPKVLPELRRLFPQSVVVGWKYEVDGTREDALARGVRQLHLCRTDACVVNGPAYGDGLALLTGEGPAHCPTRSALCAVLTEWTRARLAVASE
jgi:phosphopantothenoylcysteine synthetase/decarboxylase